MTSVDEYWTNLQSMADPSLKPEVFLAYARKRSKPSKDWFDGPPGAMVVEARSPVEAIDFVVAFSRDPSQEEWFAAKALIVETRDTWQRCRERGGRWAALGCTSVPAGSSRSLLRRPCRYGHHVSVSSSQMPREHAASLRLPRAYRYDLQKALSSSGLDDEKASRYAREAGGSLTVLKRLLGRYSGTTEPEWSRPPDAPAGIVPMLLAGSWDETSEGDRSA